MTDAHPSEAWFQLVFEAAPNAMLMVDGDRAIRLVNRGAEALFGYDRRELIGRPVEVLLPPRFAGRHAAHAQAFLERPSARAMGAGRDLYGLRKDGTEVPIEIGLSPVETSAGRITIASIVDISERAMLRERFRDLAESLPHMVWTCAGDGPCDYLSPQWVAYTGIPEEQQLGYRWLEQLHPDDIEPTKERWARAAARGGTFDTEFRIRRHDGAYRWFKTRAVPIRDAAGRITKWFGSNTDIQDLRDAQEATARLNRELEARVLARTEALREANARLETVAMQLLTAQRITQVGSWELDVATGAVTWSAELFRIFGLSPTDSAPNYRDQSALFEPESWARLQAAVTHSVATGEGYDLTLTVHRADGERRTANAHAEALHGPPGAVERLVGTFQDTTERDRVAARLHQLTERLQLATTAAKMGVWDWDVASNVLVWDETMHRLYDTSPDGFIGEYEAWRSALHPDDRAAAEATLAEAVARQTDFNMVFRIITRRGEVKHLRTAATLHRDGAGRHVRMVGVNWDITEQRLAESSLRRSEALQRTILAHAGPAIIATDLGGTITLFNRAAEELLGYAAEELIGAATPVLIHDPAEVDARRAALVRELGVAIGTPFDVFVIKARSHGADANEWTYVRKDRSRVPVLLTVSAIRGDDGEVVGYLGVAVDLSRRKEQERELLELNRLLGERSAQREVLLQEVHHRVKNNLQIIASLLSMQIRHVADASARAALAECRARVESIALIHETLYQSKDYARIPFSDYARTLAQSILRAAGPSGVALALDIEALALPVDAAIPCGLILNELVTNALKHAFPDGRRGTVRVSLRRSSAGEASLAVADDGVGLAADFAERPTRSLGLQLVSALVAQIDGRLEVSRAGGTRFCVSFPLSEPP